MSNLGLSSRIHSRCTAILEREGGKRQRDRERRERNANRYREGERERERGRERERKRKRKSKRKRKGEKSSVLLSFTKHESLSVSKL